MLPPAIAYGDLARLGVLLPSGNTVAEAELRAMLPLVGSGEAELLGMIEQLEPAARLLADAQVDAIAFHCTAVSTFAPHLAAEINRRIGGACVGTPAFATADAILAAAQAFDVRRMILVTPYIAAVHQREVAYLNAAGIEVVNGAWMGVNTNHEMGRIEPETIRRCVLETARQTQADAVFVSCTAIRSAALIMGLEDTLGMPVITSNQVLAWHALRLLNIQAPVEGFGMLFSR